jgi:serine/threonine protein kinase
MVRIVNDDKKHWPYNTPPTQAVATGDSADATVLASPVSETAVNSAQVGIELCAGTVLRDRFVLEAEIGRGGMGIVYRARDLRREEANDRKNYVAIKVLGQQLKQHPDAIIALQREARRAQQLAHPNIATVYDFDREGDIAYLCMELLNGRGLNIVLREIPFEGMPLEDALPIIQGMARGLAYAHQQGIVHADFKPGNVYLTSDGTVKILDFGIARVMPRPNQTTATRFDAGRMGALTPGYASCEMFQQQDPDPRDDVYGLACVSYELLSGKHPFQRISSTQARDNSMTPPLIPGLSRRQNQALRHGLEFSREARTSSAQHFLDELSPVIRKGLSKSAIALAVVGVLSLGAAIVIAISPPAIDPVDENEAATVPEDVAGQDTTELAETETIAEPSGLEPLPVDPETQEHIDRVLVVARAHLEMGRLVEPAGSNAAEAFADVALLQPGNRSAQQGLDAVAAGLRVKAQDLIDQGDRAGAVELVELGLQRAPDQPEMLRLRQELRR